MGKKRAPISVRCRWVRASKNKKRYDALYPALRLSSRSELKGMWVCLSCGSWTSNLPSYRYSVCQAKDRRIGKSDRRSNENG